MAIAVVSAAWFLIPWSLAVRVPRSAPGSASGAAAGAGPEAGWELCAVPQKATPAKKSLPIPGILHQTYKTADIPQVYQRSHDSWLQQAPDWEHHIWTDADNRELIATHYPWFLATYDSYPAPIERSDAARYFTLHRYGGVYADLDIEALSDPAQLISGGHDLMLFYDWGFAPAFMLDPYVWGSENGPSVGNALMASAPGHPFWMHVAKRMMKSRLDSDKWVDWNPELENFERVLWATGPWFFTLSVNEYMKESPPEVHAGITEPKYWSPSPLPTTVSVQTPCEDKEARMKRYPHAILFHHGAGQWVKWPQNDTSISRKSKRRGGPSCNREDWLLDEARR